MDNDTRAARTGWRTQEEELLFSEAERGRAQGLPLKSVFETVAKKTGRRPNSVRNYYYARIKEDEELRGRAPCGAFVPFDEQEMLELLRTVLKKQAEGRSVRSITLEMGRGDNREMLRYQNKYRALIKGNRELVERVRKELIENGEPAFDPYSARPRRNTGNLVDVVSGVVNDLSLVPGLDVTAFFESLGALALSARNGAGSSAEDASRHIYAQLKDQIRAQQEEIVMQRERFNSLLGLHRRLVTVNRSFLRMTGVTKMSSLSSYVRELSESVDYCEKLLEQERG